MSNAKKVILPISIVGLGALAIYLIMATKSVPKANPNKMVEPPKTQVTVIPAVTETATLAVKSQGTVKAKREINLVSQVSGLIVNVSDNYVSGDFFERDQILIEIDDRDYKTALLNAKVKLAQAERNLAEEKGRSRQAKKEWRDLKNQEANDLFLRKPQLAQAQADVEFAKANVELAKVNIERTKIKVPFNGRIKNTLVNLGQFVSAGTRLAEVYDTESAEVRLPLSDKQVALLNLPVSGTKFTNHPSVTLSGVIGGKNHQWQGVITRTEASVDVNSRMYYAIAEVEKPFEIYKTAPLIPGLFVTAQIEGKELNDVLVLPKDSLVKRSNLYTLDSENKVQMTPVNVLNRSAEHVWVRADIAHNTPILTEKHAVVAIGAEIEPIKSQSSEINRESNPEKQSGEVSVAKVGE